MTFTFFSAWHIGEEESVNSTKNDSQKKKKKKKSRRHSKRKRVRISSDDDYSTTLSHVNDVQKEHERAKTLKKINDSSSLNGNERKNVLWQESLRNTLRQVW